MTKPTSADQRQNVAIDVNDPEWQSIRDGFYNLPFAYADKIKDELERAALPDWLGARDRELWLPLIALGNVVESEGKGPVTNDILGLAKQSLAETGMTFEMEVLLGLLESKLDQEKTILIHPQELVFELEAALHRKGLTPEWVATRLRSLGFAKGNPPRDRQGVIYQIEIAKIVDLRNRYAHI